MKIMVFGATGRTGRLLIEQAPAEGHEVTAFVRDPTKLDIKHERLTVVQGDVRDAERVEQAVIGKDAVLSVLGPVRSETKDVLTCGAKNMVAAMEKQGVRRLVALTGAGVSKSGDPASGGRAIMLTLLKLLAGDVLEDAQGMARAIEASDLDWTILRVPRLADGPKTGTYRTGTLSLGPGAKLSRADVAHFMLRQLQDDTYLRQMPMSSY